MRRIENDCCGCALPCRGNACPLRNVEHIYCDKCGEEISCGELYLYDGNEYHGECLLEVLVEDGTIEKED